MSMIKNKTLQNTKKCKKIKLVLTDVDGVLTDGGRYYSKDGEIAFIGDDVNDIGVLEKVGFAAVPNDSVLQVKKIANFVCKSPGGKGCFREISDLILLSKFSTKTKWY